MVSQQVIEHALEAGEAYRRGELSLGAYKAWLWATAQEATALEDKELRTFLKQAESHLDRLQFTVGSRRLFEATLQVVDGVQARLRSEGRAC